MKSFAADRAAYLSDDQPGECLAELKPGSIDFLTRTARMVAADFPIETDNGTIRPFTGHRAIQRRIRGPGKEVLRFRPIMSAGSGVQRSSRGGVYCWRNVEKEEKKGEMSYAR